MGDGCCLPLLTRTTQAWLQPSQGSCYYSQATPALSLLLEHTVSSFWLQGLCSYFSCSGYSCPVDRSFVELQLWRHLPREAFSRLLLPLPCVFSIALSQSVLLLLIYLVCGRATRAAALPASLLYPWARRCERQNNQQ